MIYRAGKGKKHPMRSKTIPVEGHSERGDGEDHGRYFRCWHCNFVCNKDRDALGGPQSRDGVVLEDFAETPDRLGVDGVNNNDNSRRLCLGGSINHFHIAAANDSDGAPKGVRHSLRVSESSSGCPLCHNKNWRGDY